MQPVDKTIDGVDYRVVPFLGTDCFLHFSSMVKILGEPLTNFMLAAVSKKENVGTLSHLSAMDKDVREYLPAVSKALAVFSNKLDPSEMLSLYKALLKNTKISKGEDGKQTWQKVDFDTQFHGGKMVHLHKVIMFVLEVNFSDFLPDGVDLTTIARDLGKA